MGWTVTRIVLCVSIFVLTVIEGIWITECEFLPFLCPISKMKNVSQLHFVIHTKRPPFTCLSCEIYYSIRSTMFVIAFQF